MTEAMPFLQKFDITFLRTPTIGWEAFLLALLAFLCYHSKSLMCFERTPL